MDRRSFLKGATAVAAAPVVVTRALDLFSVSVVAEGGEPFVSNPELDSLLALAEKGVPVPRDMVNKAMGSISFCHCGACGATAMMVWDTPAGKDRCMVCGDPVDVSKFRG